MLKDKHEEILKEVLDEIKIALGSKEGLLTHQRRLAFSLSLGAETILELYLHKLNIMKEGSKIDHRWFKKKEERILEKLQNQITSPVEAIDGINKVIKLICKIEEKRDDLAYGASATEELLQEKVNLFFELKRLLKC